MQRSKRLLVTGGKIEFPARIRLQILQARLLVFFGAPLDLGGGPLDLPWGASGRLGGDFPADGPPSSQPAWGDPPVHPLHPPPALLALLLLLALLALLLLLALPVLLASLGLLGFLG